MSASHREFTSEVDRFTPDEWYRLVAGFRDANLYQLWQHGSGAERWTDVSRFALRSVSTGGVVAAAEVRVFRLPFMRRGIAYVLWGPLVRHADGAVDSTLFADVISALADEYVNRRKLVLRLNPRIYAEDAVAPNAMMAACGFSRIAGPTKRSLLVNLAPSLDDIRRQLDKKWRNCLSKAERSGLIVSTSTDLQSFDEFIGIYTRMLDRKQFAPSADIQKHRRIQQALPDNLKMRVVIARQDGVPTAGALVSAIGDTPVYLFGATDDAAMRTSAAYLVQWTVIQSLKAEGFAYYDLNGIDPVNNPGVYHFKLGLAGKGGREVAFIGQFQRARRSVANYSLLMAEQLRRRMSRARASRVQATTA